MRMYYLYKNCDLIYKCKTYKHAIRKTKRIKKKCNVMHDLIELFRGQYIIYYW